MKTAERRWKIARDVWANAAKELDRLGEEISAWTFSRCVDLLAGCRGRIVASGCGTSAMAARKIAHSLSCIERPAYYLNPSDAAHGALGAVQPGDVAILISKGGATTELVAMLPALAAKEVTVIAVTEDPDSALARAAALIVPIAIEREADEFNMLATTSTMMIVAWFDAVCIALMREGGFTRAQFATIHPGGAVGARLRGGGHDG